MSIVLRPAAATGLLLVYCLLLVAVSPPRRVGDGVEYWAMAEQMRIGRLPSATRGELARLEREARTIGHGFDTSPLRFPQLVSADGRQDFPHFWLYPLVNVPALALATALRVHPNWAFTITNIALLSLAFVIVSRRVSIAWAALILAGPLVWWLDKAHGDVFTVTLLAVACACWYARPAIGVVLIALAAAQNPALAPVWGLTCALALWPLIARRLRSNDTPSSVAPAAAIAAIAVSACIVALPLAYYKLRLDVWSPLIGYTRPSWPSLRAMASLLADANVGLIPNAPFVIVAALLTLAISARRRDASARASGWREWTLAGGACLILLAGYAQSVNLNHGATPGMNRWTLWLLPWLLLFAQPRANGARNRTPAGQVLVRRVWVVLAVLNVLWGAWFFRPSLPENYRYPTAMASWLWTHAAGWYAPAPEIFAERASHREPAPLPVAWTGCTKVLIIDGRWPAACVPTAPVPADCLGADRLCYATPPPAATSPALAASAAASEPSALDPSAGLTTFTPLGIARFPWVPARSWPSGAPFVAALREQLAAAAAREPDSRALDADPAVVRAATGVGWTTAWRGQSSLVIYVEGATANAVLELRIDADYEGWLIDLDAPVDARADRLRDTRPDGHRDSDSVRGRGATAAPLTLARSGERPSVMPLPFSVEHGLLLLTRKPPLQ